MTTRMFFNWYYKKQIGGNLFTLIYKIGGVKAQVRNKDVKVIHEILDELKKTPVLEFWSITNPGGIVLSSSEEG